MHKEVVDICPSTLHLLDACITQPHSGLKNSLKKKRKDNKMNKNSFDNKGGNLIMAKSIMFRKYNQSIK